ncbi:unnamed protein product, partial [Arabidopsis lyrata]
FYALG